MKPSDTNAKIRVALERGCMKYLNEICIISYTYMCYKQWYYLGKPIVSDQVFDSFEEKLKKYWPDNPVLEVVGLIYPKCDCCPKEKK